MRKYHALVSDKQLSRQTDRHTHTVKDGLLMC